MAPRYVPQAEHAVSFLSLLLPFVWGIRVVCSWPRGGHTRYIERNRARAMEKKRRERTREHGTNASPRGAPRDGDHLAQ